MDNLWYRYFMSKGVKDKIRDHLLVPFARYLVSPTSTAHPPGGAGFRLLWLKKGWYPGTATGTAPTGQSLMVTHSQIVQQFQSSDDCFGCWRIHVVNISQQSKWTKSSTPNFFNSSTTLAKFERKISGTSQDVYNWLVRNVVKQKLLR
ncbi:uncharacterized protein PGTG_18225 [Puccinia graminis f. sp. tritici CRL 75-36-700-3]|uniref:Uncharacterized protein n=1 Tax=Puccinia graminis f. sp. tritici (strain CRL 75-36-700-3 / race SCCL) TaxID=418459 RepID=E3L835_PUCGT|nr:uncharacterized protein PGTG_18225 [Puccinia graminis f. sp. tritici CRL 75-36-700-3]EFP92710.1 hypothetical protein PGTG_18225 [Puccinia graminis f. sp. tritici CRL 75-36-700-3]